MRSSRVSISAEQSAFEKREAAYRANNLGDEGPKAFPVRNRTDGGNCGRLW